MKLTLKDEKLKGINKPGPIESDNNWSIISKLIESSNSDSTISVHPNPNPTSPPITALDLKDKAIFGVRPLDHQISQNIIKCKDCSKPVLENALESHTLNCQLIREKQRKKAEGSTSDQINRKRGISELSDSNPSPQKKSVTSFTLTHNKSINNLTSVPLSKKDSSRGKQKASTVDVDIHCGVMLEKGYPCSRSLTCKTHSMGSKRAVLHRSLSYDTLLVNWQKNNNKSDESSVAGSGIVVGAAVGGKGEGGGRTGSSSGSRKRRKSGDAGFGGGGGGGGSTAGGGGGGGGGGEGRNGERRTIREKGKTLLVVGEWEEDLDYDNPTAPGAGDGDAAGMMIDSDEEVEKVMQVLISRSRSSSSSSSMGRPLGLGLGSSSSSGLGSMSAFAGRNLKLARLRSVLGGVFGKS